jgi:hypothetical protein
VINANHCVMLEFSGNKIGFDYFFVCFLHGYQLYKDKIKCMRN